MNLDDAIGAHSQWKIKLRMAISKRETLDAATIGKDNCCELGKWLYAEGRALYSARPQFSILVEKHKVFHGEASKVATAINAKKYEDAEKMISGSSPFGAASGEVASAISNLKKAIA